VIRTALPSGVPAGPPEADAGTRTPDPFITSEVLYQLSYVGESGSALRGVPVILASVATSNLVPPGPPEPSIRLMMPLATASTARAQIDAPALSAVVSGPRVL
jgi:hypothetical protein